MRASRESTRKHAKTTQDGYWTNNQNWQVYGQLKFLFYRHDELRYSERHWVEFLYPQWLPRTERSSSSLARVWTARRQSLLITTFEMSIAAKNWIPAWMARISICCAHAPSYKQQKNWKNWITCHIYGMVKIIIMGWFSTQKYLFFSTVISTHFGNIGQPRSIDSI